MCSLLRALMPAVALHGVVAAAGETEHHNPLEQIRLANTLDSSDDSGVQMSVNTTELVGRATWVEVSWSGVRHPSFDDWIGVLAPADAQVQESTPIKYKLASSSSTHFRDGGGSTTFLLENHRTDMRLAFFFNGFENPHLVAKTAAIKCLHPDIPVHGRVTLTGNSTEAVVQWTTGSSRGGTVKWGTSSGHYQWEIEAQDLTYTREDMCGGAAKHEGWLDPGVFHHALLTGLQPSGQYYYIFGSERTGFSKEFSFRAAPPSGPDTVVDIIALADMGQAEPDGSDEQSEMRPSANTTRLMIEDAKKGGFSLVAHFGDISYARGHVSQWDRYHSQIEPLVTSVPYMIAIGNHERDWPGSGDRFPSMQDSGGECGVAHERRFLMPTEKQDEPWFHFEHGPLHFVLYSTEQPFQKGSPQYAYIKAAFASIDRRRTPWVVFAGHRPIYIDSLNGEVPDGDQPVARDIRDAFEHLLQKYSVDLTLHGHHHSYQRTCPLYKGKCRGYAKDGTARAPVHLVIGNAGAGLSSNVHKHLPKGFEFLRLWWGYTRMHVTGTTLTVEAVSDLDGQVFDTVHLRKPSGWGTDWHQKHGPPSVQQGPKQWWWQHKAPSPPPQVERVRQHEERERRRDNEVFDAASLLRNAS
jgi:acid phosphatase type 7